MSGVDEEIKNVDEKIKLCRSSLFSLLGAAFSYSSKLSPKVQIHLWRTYCQPVLRSGLAALPLRQVHTDHLTSFHHKVIRGFLKLSKSSPIPSLYFLLGELPILGSIHLDVLSLFYTIWSNPSTTIHKLIKYILKMADRNSVTWAVHVQTICNTYELPDPLKLLEMEDAWPKLVWKSWCTTKVRSYYEKRWREKSLSNSKMTFLNTQLLGRHHPGLYGLMTTRDMKKIRPHIKMLTGDYLTYSGVATERQGGDASCRLCKKLPRSLAPSPPPPADTIPQYLIS